jgi:hypothetical protein
MEPRTDVLMGALRRVLAQPFRPVLEYVAMSPTDVPVFQTLNLENPEADRLLVEDE